MKLSYIDKSKVNKNSVIPIYYQISKLFEECIIEGKIKPGEALPSEHEIAETFQVSRMTVRRAISELINAGYVYSRKGKGTYVAKPNLDQVTFELGDPYEEILKKGKAPSSKLLEVKIVKADKLLSNRLDVPLGTNFLYFAMVLSADNEPLVYEKKYVKYTKKKPILEKELKDPSLSNLAMTHSDKFPTTTKRILHASIATKEEARVLGIDLNTPVFMVEQTIYDYEQKAIGWGKSVYRGDKYKLTSYVGWFTETDK